MPKPTRHKDFGQLVPDSWNADWFTLRQFSELAPFCSRDQPLLDDSEKAWVANWSSHIAQLAKVARSFTVRAALHAKEVHEVYVAAARGADQPAAAQAAAFRQFGENEAAISTRIIDALGRYYRKLRSVNPDWMIGEEWPDDPSTGDLAKLVEFDSLNVMHDDVDELSPLLITWSPAWDEEHGLQSLLYDGHVLIMGTDEVNDFATDPSYESAFGYLWTLDMLTPEGEQALKHFRRPRGLERGT